MQKYLEKNDFMAQAIEKTTTVILAGGRGTRLMSLTEEQAKPAVPFGGKYQIIDFTISNCINSGFNRLNLLTQYQSRTLEDYVSHGWEFLKDHGGYIRPLPATSDMNNGAGYVGTADAVYQNLDTLIKPDTEYVLILAGDHIYKMDYASMLEDHIRTGADVTVPCIEVPRLDARAFGVMAVDEKNRVLDFLEKPADPPSIPGQPDKALASMGIYIFNAKFLRRELMRDAKMPESSHDFGTDLIPRLVPVAKVYSFRFAVGCVRDGGDAAYWRDVGTVDAYWEANMEITRKRPALDLNDRDWPIYTAKRKPARPYVVQRDHKPVTLCNVISDTQVVGDSLMSKCLLSDEVRISGDCKISETVLLPGVVVGPKARLKKAIVSSNCRIPAGLVVGEDPEEDARRFYRTANGVVLINQQMLNDLT